MSEKDNGQNGAGTAGAAPELDSGAPGDDTSLDAALSAAIRDSFEPPAPARDDAVDDEPSDGPEQATADDDEPGDERAAPQSWTEAERANWDELPDAVQDTILRREREYQAGRRSDAALSKVLEPVAERLKGSDVHVDQYVSRLLQAEQVLNQNPAQAIAYWIEQYGIGEQIGDWLQGNTRQAATPAGDDASKREIAELKAQMQWDREVAKAEKAWSAFLSEHPDAGQMKDLIAAKLHADPGLDYAGAYNAAKSTIDSTLSEREKAAERTRLEGGARAASKGKSLDLPRGKGSGAPKPVSSGDLDEDIRAAMRQAGVR